MEIFVPMPWMVATAHGSPFGARDAVAEAGHSCYLPITRTRVVHRGRRIWQESSLFGQYFFVAMSDRWREIFGVRGVGSILMLPDRDEPAVARDYEISRIKQSEVRGIVPRMAARAFRRGDAVSIEVGALAGLEGTYDGGDSGSCTALVSMFGRSVRVRLRGEDSLLAAGVAA